MSTQPVPIQPQLPSSDVEILVSLILSSAEKNCLRKAVFSKPQDKSLVKMVLTPRKIGEKKVLQAEFFQKDNKAIHKNFPLTPPPAEALADIIADFMQINLIGTGAECEYRRSSSGKTILLGKDKFKNALEQTEPIRIPCADLSNNREKQYILNGSEPFLKLLGVSDSNGRVYDKKQAKFRQINRFLELIRDTESHLPKDSIRICDLCCGKSYLSFAVYHYFANIRHKKVSMTGVDLKQDVIAHCNTVARSLSFDGLEFICGDIREYQTDVSPQLVISLHACDIATDLVLMKAAEWKTDVILSTPCCHHELNHAICCPSLSFITDYSMLRQKLCDAATDALRLCRLEAQGYSTAALELIDPDETPKNIMLRAVRKKNFQPDSEHARMLSERYRSAKAFLCENADTDSFSF